MACNTTRPCRPAGIGPACWAQIEINNPPPGGEFGGGDNGPGSGNGEDANTPPENINDLLGRACCEDCDENDDTGDGGSGDGGADDGDGDDGSGFDGVEDGGGFTVENPPGGSNPGGKDKEDCIKRIEKKIATDMQDCICRCYDEAAPETKDSRMPTTMGGAPWCWGKCIEEIEADYTECFCNEITCGGGGGDGGGGSFGGGPSDPEEPEEPDLPTPDPRFTEASLGPRIGRISFPSSTYDRVIPLVYNRGIIQGNVIWAGEPREQKKCIASAVTDPDTGQITVTSTTVTQTFVDFAIAVTEGPIDGVSRIWIENNLILNNTLEVDGSGNIDASGSITTVDNIGLFNKTVEEIDKYDKTLLTVTSYNGTEDQPVDPTMNVGIAHRGLAYVVFRNFEVTAFGGSIPQIRIEVVKTSTETKPKLVSALADDELSGMSSDVLWVDRVDRRIYVGSATTGLRSLKYDTFEPVDEYDNGITLGATETLDPLTAAVSQNGTIVAQTGASTGTRPYDIVTADLNYRRSTYGEHSAEAEHTLTAIADTAKPGGHGGTFLVLREADGSYRDYFCTVAGNDLAFLKLNDVLGTVERKYALSLHDQTTDTIRYVVPLLRDKTVTTEEDFTIIRSSDFYVVATPALSQNRVTILRGVGFASDSNQTFDPDRPLTAFSIASSVWGGEEAGVSIAQVIPDERYQSLFIFLRFSNGSGACIRWSIQNERVVWTVNLEQSVPFSSAGPRVSKESSKIYHWIGGNGVVYSLNKRSGVITTNIGSLTDFDLDPIAGPQYYDYATNAITYITNDQQVARLYIGRVFSGNTALSEVIEDLFHRAGYKAHEYDASALGSVPMSGYIIDSNVTLRSILQQLSLIYNFTLRQRDNQLVTTVNTAPAVTTLNLTNTAGGNDGDVFMRTIHVDVNAFRGARVNYFDIDADLGINMQSVVNSVPPPRGQDNTGYIEANYPFAGTAQFAAEFAERLLYDATINNEKIAVRVAPSLMSIESGDRVLVDIPGLDPLSFFVNSTVVGADKSVQLDLVRSDTDAALFTPGVAVTPGIVTGGGGTEDFDIRSNVRAIPLPTNAAVPTDANPGYSRSSRFYAGVSYSGDGVFPPTAINLRTTTGALSRMGTALAPLKWGLLTIPPPPPKTFYSTDRSATLTIRFAQAGAASSFVEQDNATFFNAFGKNLILVNGELIQFRNWSVDGDGRTITFSNLLRGRHGTESEALTHAAGEFCAVYSPDSWLLGSSQALNALGDNLTLSVETGVGSSGEFVETQFYNDHDFLKFFGPSNIKRIFLSTGDITVTANRRNRTPDPIDDLRDQIIPEISQSRRVFYLLSGPYDADTFLTAVESGVTGIGEYIVRTDENGFTYTTTQQTQDTFDRATDTMYIVVTEQPEADDNIYAVPRGHTSYRAIGPNTKW